MNARIKTAYLALAIALAAACAFFFHIFYSEAKNSAILKLNQEQMIHAKQAARGIEDFFATWTRSLSSLAKMDEVLDNDAVGKRFMNLFYDANQEQIRAITRLDDKGVIIYNFPASSSEQIDISDQKHVRELMRNHKPVISDVFRAVEGYDSVALHVPILRGAEYKGSIGILIDFKNLANRYLDVIRIGETGHAWVVSRDGTLLFNSKSGLTGKPALETKADCPSFTSMVNEMLKGHEGAAVYDSNSENNRDVEPSRTYAVYMPVPVENTFWSIAVASDEHDVLSGLLSFRNRLAFVTGAIFIFGMVLSTLGAKIWLTVNEEVKRKQTENELRESEQRLALAADSANLGIWIRDLVRNEIWASDKWRGLFGFSNSEPLELQRILQRLHPNDREVVSQTLERAAVEVGGYEMEYRIVLPTGGIRWIASRGRVESNGEHKPTLIRGVSLDITELRQSEFEKQELRHELAHAGRVTVLGQLASSLAHELGQPLGAILRNAEAAELLLQTASPDLDELRAIVSDICKDDHRAGDVIDRLRKLLTRRSMEMDAINIDKLVDEVVVLMRSDSTERHIRLETNVPSGLPPVRGDRVHLQQVLLNLIMNGMDAVGAEPESERHVTLNARLDEKGMIEISVSDSGHGVPPEKLGELFQPFFTTKPNGMGMGLPISKTIVESHGGRIWAKGNPDRGTTFRFTVCVAEAEGTS